MQQLSTLSAFVIVAIYTVRGKVLRIVSCLQATGKLQQFVETGRAPPLHDDAQNHPAYSVVKAA
jgi:hypothetical protein